MIQHKYEVGEFHPSLDTNDEWYICHPAIGAMKHQDRKSIIDYLKGLKNSHWDELDDERQDAVEEKYLLEIVNWFTSKYPSTKLYFSGGYEKDEQARLVEIGLTSKFTGEWQPNFLPGIFDVNVHEFALVDEASGNKLVIFDSWDNIYCNAIEDLPGQMKESM